MIYNNIYKKIDLQCDIYRNLLLVVPQFYSANTSKNYGLFVFLKIFYIILGWGLLLIITLLSKMPGILWCLLMAQEQALKNNLKLHIESKLQGQITPSRI
jgi:hypothetical protein